MLVLIRNMLNLWNFLWHVNFHVAHCVPTVSACGVFFKLIWNWKWTRKNVARNRNGNHMISLFVSAFRYAIDSIGKFLQICHIARMYNTRTCIGCIHARAFTLKRMHISQHTRHPILFFRCQWIGVFLKALFHSLQLNRLLLSAFAVWPKYSNSEIKMRTSMFALRVSKLTTWKELESESCTFLFIFSILHKRDHITKRHIYSHRQFVITFLVSVYFLFKHIVF